MKLRYLPRFSVVALLSAAWLAVSNCVFCRGKS